MTDANDLLDLVEELKGALFEKVRGQNSEYSNEKYREVRKAILNNPETLPHAPEWLRRGSSLHDAVSRIREEAGDESGKWQRRDTIVRQGLDPVIDTLEGSDVISASQYERLELLGSGGFGEVFRYRHKLLERDFAMKLLHPSQFITEGDHALSRFFQEARILFDLRHENIVRIYDVGRIGKSAYMRMELIEGSSLTKQLRDEPPGNEALARSIVARTASALAQAHESVGVVHRDLKPSNIMIEASGRPVLLDFGLGVFVENEITSRITRTGEAPAAGVYTAPELLRDPRLIEPRTDVYSLAVIWYEMLVGCTPSGRHIESPLDEIYDLKPSETELLLDCLGPLADRPTSKELRDALLKIIDTEDRKY